MTATQGDPMSAAYERSGRLVEDAGLMSAGCELDEFLRAGQPGRVPLRSCCIAVLLAVKGERCQSLPVERAHERTCAS
ncbi:hypothetical protein JIG36_20845 [Actinoplanes sp. LDG1-06]|uniref:Uncharacterized protein n=1 Tax=Paractinoplanes ovalisporus TaxID=2810368 RepID=A0ABS2ADV2_9ACTN|nr:hypothetical protein [Actinoplanes ovalisporus]MBM2618010.1 hypothetical protein [Actinoplanes ovalisporus]